MKHFPLLFIAAIFIATACGKNKEVDTEKPVISLEQADIFPAYCDTIYFGESFNLKAYFSDDVELGSFSVDIHNNFDHHSHGHKIDECNLAPKKLPVNPLIHLDDFEIPPGTKDYEVSLPITIPAENASGLYDEGDYHFQIFLTDKEGWSTPLGLSIKILHR